MGQPSTAAWRAGPRFASPVGMAWKATVPWLGGGAALAVGFVWLQKALRWRESSPRVSQAAPPSEVSDINLDPDVNVDFDEIAHSNALHDIGDLDLGSSADFEWELPPEVGAPDDTGVTVGPSEHTIMADEPYDALEPEDVGTAWLRRATQSETSEEFDVADALEGVQQIIEGDPSLADSNQQARFGVDQEGQPLAPNAGIRADDVAAELPVGTLDAAGNAELHESDNPPDGLGAPPTGTLSPTLEEIERRAREHAADRKRSR